MLSKAGINLLNYSKGWGHYGGSMNKMMMSYAIGKPIVCNVGMRYSPIKDNNLGIDRCFESSKEYADAILEIYNLPKDESLVGQSETNTRYIIGFTPKAKNINIFNVWGEAWNETKFVVKLVYQSFWQMITGKIGVDQMSGPVGIVSEVNNAVNSGSQSWLYVLNLIALLTINLGIFNLLPIPALDGCRILFVLIEMVRRKPIPPDKEGIVHGIGMLLLILFILFISFHDIMRLFS